MTAKNIPDNDQIARYVPWGKLRKDEDDNVIGIEYSAFQLREGEGGLSCTWMDYFNDEKGENIRHVVAANKRCLKVGPKSAFAIGVVGEIKSVCRSHNKKVRIIHDPVDGNQAHCEVRRLPADDKELLGALADTAWSEFVRTADVGE